MVTFNAVVDYAMSGGSNIYGPKYDSPAGVQLNSNSQVEAIAALLGGLTVSGNNASTEPPGTSDPGAALKPRSRSVPLGPIVSGVIGGIALAGLVAASLWVYRRRARAESRDHETASQWGVPDPFLDMTPRTKGKNPPPPPEISTVLALNQHLGDARRWDPNEQPPDYSTQIEYGGTSGRGK
ncbi:hypothetical protein AAF712_015920 [Marasmius tenuissimus]|uniref:Uncharacterized protein n=1 Tax=Marasmius tenuissimus TaxID=585030 RepID=A0ABR2Z881_9AGAR